jgi:hypothetical protein
MQETEALTVSTEAFCLASELPQLSPIKQSGCIFMKLLKLFITCCKERNAIQVLQAARDADKPIWL